MAEGEAEWELSKENIQPLREGRAISALHLALSQQQEGSNYTVIQQARQAFESELRIYTGDDPLDVWDRYIKWTLQTYPQGGKESNLSVLLERAVMHFADEKKYHNDVRYVSLWIKFAEISTDPMDFYTYMHGHGIGIMQAAFYIAWAEEFEKRSNLKKADSTFQEGIKCGAEPCDKLQQYHKAFQARASRQAVLNMTNGGPEDSPEPAQPQRSTLASLKHKGKKKAIAPINRTGASISHDARGLDLNLPAASHRARHSQVVPFQENPAAEAESFEPVPEPWLAPPVAKNKENELMPEKWTNVKMPQKSKFGHSMVFPPKKPDFEPFVEECEHPPAVTPCKINPAVNTVLSARKPSKEETPLERLQEQQQQKQQASGKAGEQAMYCKDLLLSGATEFCFEELRAERYWKKRTQNREERGPKVRKTMDELRREIAEKERILAEKQRMLQERNLEAEAGHQTHHVAENDLIEHAEHLAPGPSSVSHGSATGFDDVFEPIGSSSGICPLKIHMDTDSDLPAESVPEPEMIQMNEVKSDAVPFAVFDESAVCERPPDVSSVAPSEPSVRRPLYAVWKPQGDVLSARPPSESNFPGAIEALSEDAIAGYRNNTLCHVPDDTCDFARAARLVSTPFGRGQNHRLSLGAERGPAEDAHATGTSTPTDDPASAQAGFTGALSVKNLSPIQEASLEDCSYSGSSVSSSLTGASSIKGMNLSIIPELGGSEAPPNHEPSVSEAEMEAPTSEDVRRRALEKTDLASSPNFHKKMGPLPPVNEGILLSMGDEAFTIHSRIIANESYTVHLGQSKCRENVVIKIDHQPVPWDFHIKTQLTNRLGSKFEYFADQSSCFLYEDGCITVSWGYYQGTLQERLAKSPLEEEDAAPLVIELLELVEQMHSCHLVHGNLRPDTLLRHRTGFKGLESVLRAVDFSLSLDLELQPEVTSVLGHPGAQDFLRQGILSSSSSPYQIDLLGIAETAHLMLEQRNMQLVCKDTEWGLGEDLNVASGSDGVWREFFRMILNPGTRSTVTVLSELQQLMKKQFTCSIEHELAFSHSEGF